MRDTRERLRKAALQLFVEKGFRGSTIADIETRAGLAPRAGGFYRHFASKDELLGEIVDREVIETPSELGFEGLLPLGDTRAELVLLGRAYLRATERQAPLADLRSETQRLPAVLERVSQANWRLLALGCRWLAEKPAAAGLNEKALRAWVLVVMGGWLFYLTKKVDGMLGGAIDEEATLEAWAGHWAAVLDRKDGFAGARSAPASGKSAERAARATGKKASRRGRS